MTDILPGNRGFNHQRLESLDALRGFDMFWIMGGELIFESMADATGSPFWTGLSNQFTHPAWNGFHAYDLIFPLFLFLSGVSSAYSVSSALAAGKTKREILLRIIKRGIILVLLGLLSNNWQHILSFSEWRVGSVLGRIGICYALANIVFLYAKPWAQIVWCCALLVGYWVLLKFTSAPGFPMGDLTMQGNFASYFDRIVMPGKLYEGIHDPEGLVSSIPAISTALLGIQAGKVLKSNILSPGRKIGWLAGIGIGFIVLALIWNLDFPINKNLWTSSFVLLTAGLSLLMLVLFYGVIDVLGCRKWSFFFKVIGVNSILIYLSCDIVRWGSANRILFGWLNNLAGEACGAVLMAVTQIALKWAFLYFLYRKKIFLRV